MKVKQITIATMLLLSATAWSADNSIYLDQAGDNSTITMTQEGASNRIRSIQGPGTGNTTPSVIKGNNITVTVDQIGSGNVLNLGVDAATASGGVDTNIKYKVTGNNAVATIDSNNGGTGISQSNIIDIDQNGNNAIATINMLGARNYLEVLQSGGANNKIVATINASDVSATVNQTAGAGNETTLNLTSGNGTVDIVTVGASNITSVTQSGTGGPTGQSTKININGSGNTTSVTQSGAFDQYVDVKIASASNMVNINQSGGASAGQYAKLDISGAGGSNNVSITQQGSVDNTANIKIVGGSNTYTILQKN
jgi:hypothetical protein